jgi:tyrosine-protein phosphatase YwqE
MESGIMLQLDAASITGLHGHEIQHFALQCVKKYEGSVVVASSVGGTSARPSSLALVREELLKKNQAHRVKRLLCETPSALIGETKPSSPDAQIRAFRLSHLVRPRSLRSQRVVPDES